VQHARATPVRRLEAWGAGGSTFRFWSIPFFFISGDKNRCQKLYVLVMAPRLTRPATVKVPAAGARLFPGGDHSAGRFGFPPFWASTPKFARGPGIAGEVTSRDSKAAGATADVDHGVFR
jgi:hypothetical protein